MRDDLYRFGDREDSSDFQMFRAVSVRFYFV